MYYTYNSCCGGCSKKIIAKFAAVILRCFIKVTVKKTRLSLWIMPIVSTNVIFIILNGYGVTGQSLQNICTERCILKDPVRGLGLIVLKYFFKENTCMMWNNTNEIINFAYFYRKIISESICFICFCNPRILIFHFSFLSCCFFFTSVSQHILNSIILFPNSKKTIDCELTNKVSQI